MEFLSVISNYIPLIVVLLVLCGGVIALIKDKKTLKNILLYLCTEAEKIYGSKTGQWKLKYCWDQACSRFRFLTTFLTFENFSKMVDECLVELRHLIETNDNIAEYVRTGKKINTKGDE